MRVYMVNKNWFKKKTLKTFVAELIEKLFRDIIILGGNPENFIKLPEIDSKYLKLVEMYEQ